MIKLMCRIVAQVALSPSVVKSITLLHELNDDDDDDDLCQPEVVET